MCVCARTPYDNVAEQAPPALISALNAAFVCGAFQRAAGAFKASIVVQSVAHFVGGTLIDSFPSKAYLELPFTLNYLL